MPNRSECVLCGEQMMASVAGFAESSKLVCTLFFFFDLAALDSPMDKCLALIGRQYLAEHTYAPIIVRCESSMSKLFMSFACKYVSVSDVLISSHFTFLPLSVSEFFFVVHFHHLLLSISLFSPFSPNGRFHLVNSSHPTSKYPNSCFFVHVQV